MDYQHTIIINFLKSLNVRFINFIVLLYYQRNVSNNARNIESRLLVILRTSVSHDEVMDVVVGVRISGLQGEHVSVRRCVQLNDRLHR